MGSRAGTDAAVTAEIGVEESALGNLVLDADAREHAIDWRALQSAAKQRRREAAPSKGTGDGDGHFDAAR